MRTGSERSWTSRYWSMSAESGKLLACRLIFKEARQCDVVSEILGASHRKIVRLVVAQRSRLF